MARCLPGLDVHCKRAGRPATNSLAPSTSKKLANQLPIQERVHSSTPAAGRLGQEARVDGLFARCIRPAQTLSHQCPAGAWVAFVFTGLSSCQTHDPGNTTNLQAFSELSPQDCLMQLARSMHNSLALRSSGPASTHTAGFQLAAYNYAQPSLLLLHLQLARREPSGFVFVL